MKTIVLMGGPSGGKSEAIERLKNDLKEQGREVYVIKEIASEVLESGIDPERFGRYAFQKLIFDLQRNKEDRYHALLDGREAVLLQDRCLYDHAGYLSKEQFKQLLKEEKMDLDDLSKRYDAIYFLDSVALVGHYEQRSNPVRMESEAEAIQSNEALKKAAELFEQTHIIQAYGDFEEKFQELIRQIKKSENR